jgi:RNA polymerase sigma-70 factor (ECF subfamily)
MLHWSETDGRQPTVTALENDRQPGSDNDFAIAAAAGDADAFARLIERQYDRIYALAWRWSGDQAEAEDIAQDVCVKLASAIRSFRGESNATTWIYRIAYTTTVDHIRARRRVHLVAPEQMAALVDAPDTNNAEVHMLYGELWAAVRQLPDQQRDAVLLVYGQDLSHAEAAQVMDCTEKTVSWHLHEARKRLRSAFDEVGQCR